MNFQRFLVISRFQIFDCFSQKKPGDLTAKAALFEFADSIVKEESPLDGSSNLKLIKKTNSTKIDNFEVQLLNSTNEINKKEPAKTISRIESSLLNEDVEAITLKSFVNLNSTNTSLDATLDAITEILQSSLDNKNDTKIDQILNTTSFDINNSTTEENFNENFSTLITDNITLSPAITLTTLAKSSLEPTSETVPKISFLNDECKVDLIFIIDTSQSVVLEFQKQLQFAVDLVRN